jgi:superkiller protein 3
MSKPWMSLVALLSFTASAQGEDASPEAKPTILVLPADTLGDLGSVVQLRMLGVLRELGDTNLIHPKTLNRVNERYEARLAQLDGDRVVQTLGQVMGADVVVTSKVSQVDERTRLHVEVVPVERPGREGQRSSRDIDGATWLKALTRLDKEFGPLLVESGLVDLSRTETRAAVGPASENPQALMAFARCHERLIRQPAGLRSPVVVDTDNIEAAREECRLALEDDPDFVDAKAYLALASAFLGEQREAERLLKSSRDSAHFIPMYWIAKFWVLSRYYTVDLAIDSLKMAIGEHPGFTLGRGYLGEALVAVGRPEAAIEVYEDYLARVPRQSFVMGQIGYAHSKLGQSDEAVKWTEKALRTTPSDPELLLQLASRFVDVGRYEEATILLRRVISEGGARGEVYLRLGYAYLKLGKFNEAEREMRQAILRADGPAEWRTRGRARYNLALLWVEAGSPENALRQLRFAIREGFKDRGAFNASGLAPLKKHPDLPQVLAMKPPRGKAPVLVSPLGTANEAGELELKQSRKMSSQILSRF